MVCLSSPLFLSLSLLFSCCCQLDPEAASPAHSQVGCSCPPQEPSASSSDHPPPLARTWAGVCARASCWSVRPLFPSGSHLVWGAGILGGGDARSLRWGSSMSDPLGASRRSVTTRIWPCGTWFLTSEAQEPGKSVGFQEFQFCSLVARESEEAEPLPPPTHSPSEDMACSGSTCWPVWET